MLKFLLFLLAVILVALFVADTIARNTAEDRVESRLASSVEAAEGLEVEVGGILFLPQLFTGGFDKVVVSMDAIERGGVTVQDVRITLRDLEFSLGDLLSNEGAVSVRGGRGRAVISEASVNEALRAEGIQAEIELDGSASISAGGRSAEVQDISVDESGGVVFDAPPLEPLRLELPATLERVRYSDARVRGKRLVISLDVSGGSLNL